MALLIGFYFAYNVYCMLVYNINCKDLALIFFMRRSQLIRCVCPQLAYISCLPSLLYKIEIFLIAKGFTVISMIRSPSFKLDAEHKAQKNPQKT